jgi:hypothetical protein
MFASSFEVYPRVSSVSAYRRHVTFSTFRQRPHRNAKTKREST